MTHKNRLKILAIPILTIFFLGCAKVDAPVLSDAEKNLAESNEFFEANRAANGVFETDSGLQYKVIKTGNGISPTFDSTVNVFYRGYFIGSDNPFDYAADESKPTRISLSAVIPGWQEGISLMTEGSRWTLYIPPHLAYGEKGALPVIGPNKALIYDVELVKVE